MFELPTFGQAAQLIFLIGLIYWSIKTTNDESQKRKIRHQEEKALLDNMVNLTTTRVKFERHLWSILDKVASLKLQSVIITDEKEIPQSVLLPYAEYKLLQERYNTDQTLNKFNERVQHNDELSQ